MNQLTKLEDLAGRTVERAEARECNAAPCITLRFTDQSYAVIFDGDLGDILFSPEDLRSMGIVTESEYDALSTRTRDLAELARLKALYPEG